jgi:hypothetical protein
MPQSKKLYFVFTREGLGELPRPSALRMRLMHFPFEIIIWDTKVFYNLVYGLSGLKNDNVT